MGLPPFDQVVAEHGDVVHRVCRAVVGAQDADDAWSEAMLAALRGYPALRPDSAVRAWLVTVAHNAAVDLARRRARTPVPAAAVPDGAAPPADLGAGFAGAEPPDQPLVDALAALPPTQRAAVTYRYVADLSYRDVAALLGGTEAAARRAAADGVATLRRTYPPAPPAGPPGDPRTAPTADPEETP